MGTDTSLVTPTKWVSAWCSIIGTSHITEGFPCQDSSKVKCIGDCNFIIAAIADGAGSCENSHIGSKFLVDAAIEKLSLIVTLKDWINDLSTLNAEVWRNEAFQIFKELKNELYKISEESNLSFNSLSSTLIVAISNGSFIACANIGDGRATFRSTDGEWFSMLTPSKGEEVNQTVFITSGLWDTSSDSEYYGSFFYDEQITALSLLSDGCERASFEILKFNEEENKYYDPNKPFKPFFEPNYQSLYKLNELNIDQEQINHLWKNFIENGTDKLISETDDKSMILSLCLRDVKDETTD